MAEIMSICGFAFLAIDTEHSPIDIEGNMVCCRQSSQVILIVRL
jgi:2-keto-3-deoxy-L-rhamnonate aldolase RhmA